ncbi:hypothetical protein ILUMI_04024 [Ignelater luminosus]|uniref:Uncharacterized protein n=1 Tax=Ignelater luminosus TaxID=2038154 RepID=A0A8K0DF54_IGNLU|nr:hypothetical protein ILUMI_04024 [Ignelater luminosus]
MNQKIRTKRLPREKKRRYNKELLRKIEGELRKDKNGKIIVEENPILDRWQEYYSELLNNLEEEVEGDELQRNHHEQTAQNQREEEEQPPDKEDIEKIIKNFKNNKSPGNEGITSEMFKYRELELVKQMQKLIEEIWIQEQMPSEWTEATICPISKKGDSISKIG